MSKLVGRAELGIDGLIKVIGCATTDLALEMSADGAAGPGYAGHARGDGELVRYVPLPSI